MICSVISVLLVSGDESSWFIGGIAGFGTAILLTSPMVKRLFANKQGVGESQYYLSMFTVLGVGVLASYVWQFDRNTCYIVVAAFPLLYYYAYTIIREVISNLVSFFGKQ